MVGAIALSGWSCRDQTLSGSGSGVPTAVTTSAEDTHSAVEKIKFKQGNGDEKFSLKFEPDGAKLVDGADQELARLTLDASIHRNAGGSRQGAGKVKIKDINHQVLGYVVIHDGYWKLENAAQTEELYILRLQADGDLKLEDGTDKLVYRVKRRDYGYEIESPKKTSLYKVKVKGDKTSLRNANDETVLSTKSPILSTAMACFGFDVLSPAQQAALAYAVNLSEDL
ncbi:MAG: hypothetical protein HC800_24970 [Phormidesmis sp. RL_2_1]|nr:hypothetical protein [Phormidesmis sp. RL_2_1]